MAVFALVFSALLLREKHQLEDIQKIEATTNEALSSLANRLAYNHLQIYELMRTAESGADEGEFYDIGKPYLYEIHVVEKELDQMVSTGILNSFVIEQTKTLIKRITEYRLRTTNAMLMATVDIALARSVLSASTQLFNILNVDFLELNALQQSEIQTKYRHHQLNIDQLIKAFALIAVLITLGMLIYTGISSRYLARDLSNLITKLSIMTSSDAEISLDTDKTGNEVAILSQAVDDAQKSHLLLTEMQEQLSQKETRLRAIFDNMIGAIITTDAVGRIDSFNPMAELIFGYSAEEAIGQNISELIPSRGVYTGPERRKVPRTAVAYEGSSGVDEAKGRHKDGHLFPIKSSVTEYRIGDHKMSVELLQDITDLEDTEQKLRQFQRMEAIGQLTGGIAHDFNNLLGVMMGNAELIEGNEGANEEIVHRINDLKNAIDRGASLTERLLAYSRKQTLRPTAVSVISLLDGMTEMMVRSLTAAIEIKIETVPGLWLAQVDEHQLEDALLNLAINARDAMPHGGLLQIKAKNFTLGIDIPKRLEGMASGEYIEISVADSGIGMSPAQRSQVFEPFFTTKDVGEGSGLGLSMVYGFSKQSKGHVTLESEVGKGTTIFLYLPRSVAQFSKKPQRKLDIQDQTACETILLVEDNHDLRKATRERLNLLGYKIIEASDGGAALALLDTTEDIDLLLTDVILPEGLNGFEISAQASHIRPGLSVLFMSGHPREALADVGLSESQLDILQKPFRSKELALKIRVALNR